MAQAKSVSVLLMDGTSNGSIKCSMMNWNGLAFKIPRNKLGEFKDRKELKQSGVYFLFGNSDDNAKPVVYVGHAGDRKNGEAILNRLLEHDGNPEKDYWTEAVAFTTRDGVFGPTEIDYLEYSFCRLARDAGRYNVKNVVDPSTVNLTEEKEIEMREYMEDAELILGVLGYKIFIPLVRSNSYSSDETVSGDAYFDTKLHLTHFVKRYNMTAIGYALRTAEGIVVLRGSVLAPEASKSVSDIVALKRKQANVVDNVLQEDVLFYSPSGASSFVIGNASDGRVEWRDANNVPLYKLPGVSSDASEEKSKVDEAFVAKAKNGARFGSSEGEKVDVVLRRYIKSADFHLAAKGVYDPARKNFVVLAGSMISPDIAKAVESKVKRQREHAKIENGILLEDVVFSSPSGASDFVIGNSSNGWTEWKDENGVNLSDLTGEDK